VTLKGGVVEKRGRRNSLEDDVERVLVPHHALVLDDAGMREPLDEFDLLHELGNLVLAESLEPDPLDGDHLSRREVQGSVLYDINRGVSWTSWQINKGT
jgi:hypothetical protein